MFKANGDRARSNNCCFRSHYKTLQFLRKFLIPILNHLLQVTPTFIPILNDCGERNREVIITLRPHLPIRVASVKVDLVSLRNQLIDEICVVGEQEFSECGLIFKKNHRVGRPLRFKLMTSCATGDKSKTQEETYQLLHGFYGPPNGFWLKHDFPIIKVHIS